VAGPVLIALAGFLLGSVPLAAQTTDRDEAGKLPRWTVTPYAGVARHSLVGTHLGVTPDRDHLFFGLHATLNFWRTPRGAFGYAPELVPLLLITNNPTYRVLSTPGGFRLMIENGRAPVAGFACSPIGFEGQLRTGARWRAYAAGAAGAVWFTRDVPAAYSSRFNYTFEVGGGVLWQYQERHALRLGYKFHHLSNAYRAPQNPGIDGAVLLAGFERSSRAGR
jgi:hypothetical protein